MTRADRAEQSRADSLPKGYRDKPESEDLTGSRARVPGLSLFDAGLTESRLSQPRPRLPVERVRVCVDDYVL